MVNKSLEFLKLIFKKENSVAIFYSLLVLVITFVPETVLTKGLTAITGLLVLLLNVSFNKLSNENTELKMRLNEFEITLNIKKVGGSASQT
jgi:hypothetical protein